MKLYIAKNVRGAIRRAGYSGDLPAVFLPSPGCVLELKGAHTTVFVMGAFDLNPTGKRLWSVFVP